MLWQRIWHSDSSFIVTSVLLCMASPRLVLAMLKVGSTLVVLSRAAPHGSHPSGPSESAMSPLPSGWLV